MSHEAAGSICHSHKIACELYPSRQVAICVDPYCGYGLVMWCLSRYVYRTQFDYVIFHLRNVKGTIL